MNLPSRSSLIFACSERIWKNVRRTFLLESGRALTIVRNLFPLSQGRTIKNSGIKPRYLITSSFSQGGVVLDRSLYFSTIIFTLLSSSVSVFLLSASFFACPFFRNLRRVFRYGRVLWLGGRSGYICNPRTATGRPCPLLSLSNLTSFPGFWSLKKQVFKIRLVMEWRL